MRKNWVPNFLLSKLHLNLSALLIIYFGVSKLIRFAKYHHSHYGNYLIY